MITAISKVHAKNGPWATNGGYEYNVVLIAVVLALAEGGPGPLSLDRVLGYEKRGARWALAALAGAVAGSLGAQRAAESAAPTAPVVSSTDDSEGSAVPLDAEVSTSG